MKNKILSVFLAVMLLLACFAPATFAAEAEEHDHDHSVEFYANTTFAAAATAYRNAVAALKGHVVSGSYTHTAASYSALKTADDAKYALLEAAANDTSGAYATFLAEPYEGTTYTGYHNARKSEFDSLSAALIADYKEYIDVLKPMDTASNTYATIYSAMKANYDLLLPHEVAALPAEYAFSTVTVPGTSGGTTPGGSTSSEALKDIEMATTLNGLITAVNAAAAKLNSLELADRMKVNEAQIVVTYLSKVNSNTLLTITGTSLGASEAIYNSYKDFSDFQKSICARITDVDNATFIKVCEIATKFYEIANSSDATIISLYTAFNALSSPDKYCNPSFREALYASYQAFTTECSMNVSVEGFDSNTRQATIKVTLSAGYTVTSARVLLDISGIWFTNAWLGGVSAQNTSIMNTSNNSGVLEIDLSAISGYTATVTIVLRVPSDYTEKEVNISVTGTVNSINSSSDIYGTAKVLCCSHKVGGALVYEQKTVKPATCSEAGIIAYFCKLCGARLTTKDGAPADIPLLSSAHTPGEKVTAGVTNRPSTCTTAGIQYFECADCHAVITKGVTLPASHKVNVNTITWNATANTWNANCTGCNAVFDAAATKALCTCEATYGKSFAKVIASKAATCGVRGYQVYQCQVCTVTWVESYGQVLENHTWGAWVTTTPATCTAEGVQTSTCSVCLQTKTQPVAMLAHDYQVQTYTASTCVTQGDAVEKCTRCGAVNSYKLPLADHTYGEGVVLTPATCAATGVKEFTCTVCNTFKKTETIAIDPNNHVELVTETVTKATCLEDGLDVTTCKGCTHRVETVTEATGHNWQTVTSEDKLTEKKCLNCKTVWSQKETKKTTILNITSAGHFTFSINNSDIAEKDVEFVVTDVELPEEYVDVFNDFYDDGKYDAKYYGAYAAELLIDGEKASATEDMSLVIDLGEDFKKKEFFVLAINADNTFDKIEAERDGATIVIAGEDYNDMADKTFVVMTSNEKAGSSPVVAIIICVAVVAIAGIAIVLVLTTKGGKKKGVRV